MTKPPEDDNGIVIDEGTPRVDQRLAVRPQDLCAGLAAYDDEKNAIAYGFFQLQQLRDLVHGTAVEPAMRAFDTTNRIEAIAKLNMKFGVALGHLKRAMASFTVTLLTDAATGKPSLDTQNASAIHEALGPVAETFRRIPTDGPRMAGRAKIAPNTHLLALFDEMLSDMDFINNPNKVTYMFNVLGEYFDAVASGTSQSVDETIHTTYAQVTEVRNAFGELKDVAEAAETFDLKHDIETLLVWEQTLTKLIEIFVAAFAQFQSLHRTNVEGLIGLLDPEVVAKVLRECYRDQRDLAARIEAKRVADNKANTPAKGLTRFLPDFLKPANEEPISEPQPITHARLNKMMSDMGERISAVQRLLDTMRVQGQEQRK